jgi:hypothetical protein
MGTITQRLVIGENIVRDHGALTRCAAPAHRVSAAASMSPPVQYQRCKETGGCMNAKSKPATTSEATG